MFPTAQHDPLQFPSIRLSTHRLVCLSIHLYLVPCLASMVPLPDWVPCLGSEPQSANWGPYELIKLQDFLFASVSFP